jgi:hypothetical protein
MVVSVTYFPKNMEVMTFRSTVVSGKLFILRLNSELVALNISGTSQYRIPKVYANCNPTP